MHLRRRKSARQARITQRQTEEQQSVKPGQVGGRFKPLTENDIEKIHHAALDLLATIGIGDPIDDTRERALTKGCHINDQGRLCFPKVFVEDIIAGAAKNFTLYGRDPKNDLEIGGERVYFSTCGESVQTLDIGSNEYRPSSLRDIYDFARLADKLEHIHMFAQTSIANELSENTLSHDINAAYALMSGTTKHVSMAVMDASSVDLVFEMAYIIAGGEEAFRKRPFFSIGQCPIVSPLKFGFENSEAITRAIQYGAPVEFAVVPQSGATGPAALAGNLVVSTAETLAALILVNLVQPGHPATCGNWPFVSDLRTGAFSGGSGEEAIMSAAAAQIINFYNLPSHTAAAMSDAKLPDAQAGYEKALSLALAGHTGCNLVYESAGMLASLMCCSFEAMVIDNDIIGAVQRTIRGIEVNDETMSLDVIKESAIDPGHFLGHAQTLELMQSEYLYPNIADRNDYQTWKENGSNDIRNCAATIASDILANHTGGTFDSAIDQAIRSQFDIRLNSHEVNIVN